MKYLLTGANGRVLRDRLMFVDPRTRDGWVDRPNITVHEIADADANAIGTQLESIEQGGYATFDGTTVTLVPRINAIERMPFRRQLGMVLNTLNAGQRSAIINLIGPGFALDDPEVMAAAVNAIDETGKPPKFIQIKNDVLTIIGREVTKRAGV